MITNFNKEEVKRITVCGVSEETRYLLKGERTQLFPKQFFNENSSLLQMKEDFNKALGCGEVLFHWRNSLV